MQFIHAPESLVTGVILTAGNLVWTILNIKVQSTFERRMREEFCTRQECAANMRLVDVRHEELEHRLDRAGA